MVGGAQFPSIGGQPLRRVDSWVLVDGIRAGRVYWVGDR